MSRVRKPQIKDGTLTAEWGKLPYDAPDICFTWGKGCSSADARLLNNALGGKMYSEIKKDYEDSLIEELKARGYDITTLKFSIRKLE